MKRRFPTDEEAEAWVAKHIASLDRIEQEMGTGYTDQMVAASNEVDVLSQRMRGVWKDKGIFSFGSRGNPSHHTLLGWARCYLAAMSVGITPVCKHTQADAEIGISTLRPTILMLDPPIAVCQKCLPSKMAAIMRIGHQFNHECDRCGAHAEGMYPFQLSMGPLIMHGHLCERCTEDDRRWASQGPKPMDGEHRRKGLP